MMFAVLPFLKNLVGMVLNLVSFVFALMISSVVIATAWLFYRPLISLAVLGGAVVIGFLVWKFVITPMRAKEDAETPDPQPEPVG
jgi:membrane protein YdbS with pleckstrin-like domain